MERRNRDTQKLALISEEAAEWLVRLRDEKLGFVDRLRYAQWLKQSPSHVAEMLRVAGLDGYLHESRLRGISGSVMPSNVIELNCRTKMYKSRNPRRWFTTWLNRKFAAGFSAVALVAVGAVFLGPFWVSSSINTDVGEWRRVILTDGSVVHVGPRSRIRFDFDDKARRDVYLTRGEALFQVARNPGRPFLVRTDLAVVRAVGTQFGVTLRGDEVSVTVKEGKVTVMHGEVPRSPLQNSTPAKAESAVNAPVNLTADEQITVSARTWPLKTQRVNADHELAWAQGRLIFDETKATTVAQAAEEFNRRNRVQIVVDDPAIAAKLVCCSFSIDDPESFVQSVVTGSRKHDVSLVREGTVILRLVPTESRVSN